MRTIMLHTVALAALAFGLATPSFSQEEIGTPAAVNPSVAVAIDNAGPYPFVADTALADTNPADGAAMQTLVVGLGAPERSDLDSRCGVIIANPATAGGDAASFCHSLQVAELNAPMMPDANDQG